MRTYGTATGRHPSANVEREQEIMRLRGEGVTIEKLAERYDVSVSVINAIIRRVRREQLQAFAPSQMCPSHLVAGCPQCMS